MSELLGASDVRPRMPPDVLSATRNGLSKVNDVFSLWNHEPV